MAGGTQTIWWENRGNTTWVGCPDCRKWFHVSAGLLAQGDANLFCPFCREWIRRERITEVSAP